MKKIISGIFIFLSVLLFLACSRQMNETPKLNHIQIIGSHNSYKQAIQPELWEQLYDKDSSRAMALQYEHIDLTSQLELGLRSLEIDIFHDPKGGRYKKPLGNYLLRDRGVDPLPFDEKNELDKPGLKVFHVQDIDFRSHRLLFRNALLEIKQWSDQNEEHLPIIITLNAKDSPVDLPDFVKPLPFSKTALDSIDLEIRSVFNHEDLITPDFVRGEFQQLEEAILKRGWPDLSVVSGRLMFVLDERGDKLLRYIEDHPALKHRVMFTNSQENTPEAAFRIVNDPVKDLAYIKTLVAKGYMVRTRADAGTFEARNNDYTRFEKAMESGAQVISSDYYLPSKLFKSDFKVSFEGAIYEKVITK
ncbi:phosphatidylinositol-specific phospholipase C1-like protein [Fulvivirgaceae bacterium BMA12]|uniref:Phosphatidylinositol-specific phospholipase C1-like protein n=1 Tax=Agaribacillus aureus TaxID=3051825 RepID=A0ABT8LHB4_9BACT|nr:phosphatidylinositol-specific phospholipase C1-like protein [Fulvivirgaceae bacterium BMA12]